MKEPVAISSSENKSSESDDLPEGWRVAYLAEVCTPPQYGWTTSSENNASGLKIVRTSDISSGQLDWSTVPACKDEPENIEKFLLRPGDILISRAGSVGTSYIIKDCPRAVFASYLIRFRALPSIETSYLGLFLQSRLYWNSIAGETIGITIPNVNASKLKQIPIPLPPLSEQHRIVARVEALLTQINAARDRLNRVPLIMKRFRQAVLAAACSGRLTEGWREGILLDETELINGSREFLSLSMDQKSEKIPNGWKLVNLEQISDSRLGKMLDKMKNRGEITPYLRNTNVRWFGFDLSDVKMMRVSNIEKDELSVQRGDILVCEGGEPGRCAIWKDNETNFIFQKALHRIRVFDTILPDWICYCLKDASDSGRLSNLFTGSTIKHLTGVALKKFEFFLPPISEQYEIVRRVNALFALADQIENQVAGATKRTEALTQAVLAEAFRGELVHTNT